MTPEQTDYSATTSNATNKVTATGEGELTLDLNGEPLENGTAAQWEKGENTVIVTSEESGTEYTVIVTRS